MGCWLVPQAFPICPVCPVCVCVFLGHGHICSRDCFCQEHLSLAIKTSPRKKTLCNTGCALRGITGILLATFREAAQVKQGADGEKNSSQLPRQPGMSHCSAGLIAVSINA